MHRIALLIAAALTLPLAALLPPALEAQTPPAAEIRQLARAQHGPALRLYREFLRLPNDAAYPEDILRLVEWMEQAFAARGFDTARLDTPGSPLLLAERDFGAAATVLVYLQSDGQPVDPSAWQQEDPYEPTLKAMDARGEWQPLPWERLAGELDPDWRIFARSASDSKGPMTQFLAAMDALNAAGREPDFNLKVIVDTEEELGSPQLPAAVREHRDRLAADMLLIFDGPPHSSNRPTVKFGARGIMTLTLTTYGPKKPLHSGHYGNFVPNPAFRLARLLASMKNEDGQVLIEGFYDGIEISDEVRAVLSRVPDDESAILAANGVAAPEQVADSLQEALQFPSLNVRGLRSAWVGREARTIVPATAVAEIDVRLVAESDPDELLARIRAHVARQGFHVTDREPSDEERLRHRKILTLTHSFSYAAFRSDFDAPPGLLARRALTRLYGEEPILLRTSGGSIPISPFVETLGLPAAMVPTVNGDNNQHSPNENIRLGNFLEGIAMLIAVLSEPLPN